jgi:hypothetical protein
MKTLKRNKVDEEKKPALLTQAEAETILRLRLIVARAAQTDCLHWWEDRSLTPEGDFMTTRLFFAQPRIAGAKTALGAARARHWDAIKRAPQVVHLFELGDAIEFELTPIPLEENWIPAAFPDKEAFYAELTRLIPEGAAFNVETGTDLAPETLKIRSTPDNFQLKPIMAEVGALALAYNGGRVNHPIFPYIQRSL